MSDELRPTWMSPKVYLGVAGLLLLIDAVLLGTGWLDAEQIASFEFDLFKLLFNVALLTIGGGLIKQAIDEQRALERFRVEVTKALGDVHGTIYVARRRLRMAGTDAARVEQALVELMQARAALGGVGHHVRTRRDIGQQTVVDNIRVARAYLEEVIEETVEGCRRGGAFEPGPKLAGFLAPEPEPTELEPDAEPPPPSEYRRRFKAPYLRAKIAADPSWQTTDEQRATAKLPPPGSRGDQFEFTSPSN